MVLLFEWIERERKNIFNNCGINFTGEYKISYNPNSHELTINKNNSGIIKDFYTLDGSNVVKQVTCFLGKNGSGKTTLLKYIYATDLMDMEGKYGQKHTEWNTIQVVESEGKIIIYHNQKEIFVKCDESAIHYKIWQVNNRNIIDETSGSMNYMHLTKIFISNDYYVYINNNLRMEGYMTKFAFTPYDISLLQSEFMNLITKRSNSIIFLNNLTYKFNDYLCKGINRQFFQNILYILFYRNLFKLKKLEKFKYFKNARITFQMIKGSDAYIDSFGLNSLIINRFTLEKIINNQFDQNEVMQFAKQEQIKFDFDLLKICAVHELVVKKCCIKNESIYTNLRINLITEILLSLLDVKYNICELESFNNIAALITLLEKEIKKISDDNSVVLNNQLEYLRNAYESINKLKHVCPNVENETTILLDENSSFIDYYYEEIMSKKSFAIKYLWLDYGCSAGEKAFLNIFSDINSFSELKFLSNYSANGINKNVLLILDEPDLYCHPEWQRKMLHEIIESLELLYQGYSFQIIFSTHSPLFLSDIPRDNIVLIDKPEKSAGEINKNTQTFGANIFDLYKSEFFIDSFIGEFALHKISKVIKQVSELYKNPVLVSSEELNKIENMVNFIGEPILKNKLIDMIEIIKKGANQ